MTLEASLPRGPARGGVAPSTSPIDLAAFLALAEPETIALLHTFPDLDAAGGVIAVREQVRAVVAAVPATPRPDDVTLTVEADGTRVFTPVDGATDRGILWIHGGGLIAGEPKQDDAHCAEMASGHGVVVRACTYGLAPEAPYPSGLEDCVGALQRAIAHLGSVLIVGGSAGGGLAIATALVARDRGMEGVRGIVAYFPMLDDRAGRASMERMTVRKTWNADLDRLAWAAYLSGVGDDVPFYAAPARATADQLRGLPPVFMDVGTLDGFFDEDLAFAQSLARADVPVELCVTPRAWHSSETVSSGAPSSRRILAARQSARERMLADG